MHSYLRYGITAWGNASKTALQPLKSLVNRAVRIMTFAPFGNIDIDSIYKYLNIPQLPQISDLEIGKFIYKSQKGFLPTRNIANHFELRNANVSHSYNLRDRRIAMNPISFNSIHGEKSIQRRGATLWNELSAEIRNSESLNIFKSRFKAHLIEQDQNDEDDFFDILF